MGPRDAQRRALLPSAVTTPRGRIQTPDESSWLESSCRRMAAEPRRARMRAPCATAPPDLSSCRSGRHAVAASTGDASLKCSLVTLRDRWLVITPSNTDHTEGLPCLPPPTHHSAQHTSVRLYLRRYRGGARAPSVRRARAGLEFCFLNVDA